MLKRKICLYDRSLNENKFYFDVFKIHYFIQIGSSHTINTNYVKTISNHTVANWENEWKVWKKKLHIMIFVLNVYLEQIPNVQWIYDENRIFLLGIRMIIIRIANFTVADFFFFFYILFFRFQKPDEKFFFLLRSL